MTNVVAILSFFDITINLIANVFRLCHNIISRDLEDDYMIDSYVYIKCIQRDISMRELDIGNR